MSWSWGSASKKDKERRGRTGAGPKWTAQEVEVRARKCVCARARREDHVPPCCTHMDRPLQAWKAIRRLRKQREQSHPSRGSLDFLDTQAPAERPGSPGALKTAGCWSWFLPQPRGGRNQGSYGRLTAENELAAFQREASAKRQRQAALAPHRADQRRREDLVAGQDPRFVCPLSGGLMVDPVVADDGNYLERRL